MSTGSTGTGKYLLGEHILSTRYKWSLEERSEYYGAYTVECWTREVPAGGAQYTWELKGINVRGEYLILLDFQRAI